jgi:flagellar basal body P-ring formation protein FlgA
MDNGTEGDVVSVMNLQSKRIVSGVVIGRGQVSISVTMPRLGPEADAAPSSTVGGAAPASPSSAPVSVANISPAALKAE